MRSREKNYCENYYLVINFDTYEDREKFEQLLEKIDDIYGEDVTSEVYVAESCPQCGDSEFWGSDGHCGHCGFSAE